jgi:hypothetical protein
MNLTIPIMEGQVANIQIFDTKSKESFTWTANHNKVRCFRMDRNKGVMAFSYDAISNENFDAKGLGKIGIGRNKRRCPTSLKLDNLTKGEG